MFNDKSLQISAFSRSFFETDFASSFSYNIVFNNIIVQDKIKIYFFTSFIVSLIKK